MNNRLYTRLKSAFVEEGFDRKLNLECITRRSPTYHVNEHVEHQIISVNKNEVYRKKLQINHL